VALPWQACLRRFACPAYRFESTAWLVRLCRLILSPFEQVRCRAAMLDLDANIRKFVVAAASDLYEVVGSRDVKSKRTPIGADCFE
jgi:hypothetical protein